MAQPYYKIKSMLDMEGVMAKVSPDLQENIQLIKTLSEDFTIDDETAHELDELMKVEMDALYDGYHKENMAEYDEAKQVAEPEQETEEEDELPEATPIETKDDPTAEQTVFMGIDYKYANRYELNRAIESLLDSKETFTSDEKVFMAKYSGYGGLAEFGAKGEGLFHEYYTPDEIVKKMWALAYKHGYKGGNFIESSCGTGRFIKYSPDASLCTAYEINPYSAKITKILYPEADVIVERFEKLFIKQNSSIKNKTYGMDNYELNIGNPPYGELNGKYFGMGEGDYSKAANLVEYFIFRGLDLIEKGGLLIMIVGAEVKNGGRLFLDTSETKCKKMIAEKGELIDAYRMPSGIFVDTKVTSEILVIRKK